MKFRVLGKKKKEKEKYVSDKLYKIINSNYNIVESGDVSGTLDAFSDSRPE